MKINKNSTNPTNRKEFKAPPVVTSKSKTIYSIPPDKFENLGQSKKPLIDVGKEVKDTPKRKEVAGQEVLPEAIGQKEIV